MFVSVETSGTVTVVRVDRPPANAISIELLDELVDALEGLAAEAPAAVVIAGRVGFFSAGRRPEGSAGVRTRRAASDGQRINRMVLATYGMPCPVIAAVTDTPSPAAWCWRCAPICGSRRWRGVTD